MAVTYGHSDSPFALGKSFALRALLRNVWAAIAALIRNLRGRKLLTLRAAVGKPAPTNTSRYQRHQPEKTLLYQLVQKYYRAFQEHQTAERRSVLPVSSIIALKPCLGEGKVKREYSHSR